MKSQLRKAVGIGHLSVFYSGAAKTFRDEELTTPNMGRCRTLRWVSPFSGID
jgi:hypothetical protein